MKDPAFLFYPSDFIVGTLYMTNEETGMYIRILCALADKDRLMESHIKLLINAEKIPEIVINKLSTDGDGWYYNLRLRQEQEKRRKFRESRLNNLKGKKNTTTTRDSHTVHRMENVNEDVDLNVLNNNNGVEKKVRSLFIQYWNYNPPTIHLVRTAIDYIAEYGEKTLSEALAISSEYGKRSNFKYLKGVCEGLLKKKQLDQIKDREKRAVAIKVEESKIAWDPETSKIFHDIINKVETKTIEVITKPSNKDQLIRNRNFQDAVEKGELK